MNEAKVEHPSATADKHLGISHMRPTFPPVSVDFHLSPSPLCPFHHLVHHHSLLRSIFIFISSPVLWLSVCLGPTRCEAGENLPATPWRRFRHLNRGRGLALVVSPTTSSPLIRCRFACCLMATDMMYYRDCTVHVSRQ